jgi:hypothetical protein
MQRVLDVREDLGVRDPKHAKAATFQRQGLAAILLLEIVVDRPVDFDHEGRGEAEEVHDEPIDDLLPPKMEASQPVPSQVFPQRAFCGSHLPS